MYMYKNYELEHFEIEYIHEYAIYVIIWKYEYEIIQFTYNYEYIYMNSYMHIQCI